MFSDACVVFFDQNGNYLASNINRQDVHVLQNIADWQFTDPNTQSRFSSAEFSEQLQETASLPIVTDVGQTRWHGVLFSLIDRDGQHCFAVHLIESEAFKNQEMCSHNCLERIVELTPAVTYQMTINKHVTVNYLTKSAFHILGYQPSEIIQVKNWWVDHIHPHDKDKFINRFFISAAGDEETIYECEYRIQHKDGHYLWIADRARIVEAIKEQPIGMLVGSIINITDAVRLSNQLQTLAEVSPGMLFQYERVGRYKTVFSYASPQILDFFGISHQTAARNSKYVFNVIHPEDKRNVISTLNDAENGYKEWECEFRVVLQDTIHWLYGHALPVKNDDGKYIWAGLIIDISEQKELELKLQKESTTDPLTGAYNRRYFNSRLQQEMKALKKGRHRKLSLLAIDFDFFKKINDEHGHDAGDHVLQQVAIIILHHIRKTDCFCRVGGEEFNIILPNTSDSDAHHIADKIRQLVDSAEIRYQGRAIPITITIGISSTETGITEEKELMRDADRALYKGKELGRNCVV